MAGYITHINDVEPVTNSGDTASVKTTIDNSAGAERLIQSVIRFSNGKSLTRHAGDRDEVAYVASGAGTLFLDGDAHNLHPDVGIYIRARESYEVANNASDDIVIISVTAPPPQNLNTDLTRKVIVDTQDQEIIPAGKDRKFKFVINPDAGCQEVSQFVGWIPPGRAPTHYHLYDEVMYILDGDGVLHLEGQRDTPISTGTCIHLPPPVEHCVENTGDRPLRVLGVFHPAGSAAEAYEDTSDTN